MLSDTVRYVDEDAGKGENVGQALEPYDPDEESSFNFIINRDDQYITTLNLVVANCDFKGRMYWTLLKNQCTSSDEVKDGGSPTLSSQASVMIHVNITNRLPIFSQQEYHFSISEDFMAGAYVGTVQASDRDMKNNSN